MTTRETIIKAFAEWTAYSSTRSGWPREVRKDRGTVYPLIRTPDYEKLLSMENPSAEDFSIWHEANTKRIYAAEPNLPVGWAVKLINVYLKTTVYVAKRGPEVLLNFIHPPIDGGLWSGIKKEYGNDKDIFKKTHRVDRIKNITAIYMEIIQGCQKIARRRGCTLFEVEALWEGTNIE